jgi:hypothetical protein
MSESLSERARGDSPSFRPGAPARGPRRRPDCGPNGPYSGAAGRCARAIRDRIPLSSLAGAGSCLTNARTCRALTF